VRLRRPLQILLAPIVVNYIKLVVKTSTIVADPPDYVARGHKYHPSIIALWHGQFFLLPGIYPQEIPGRAIVAKHDDAEALRRILKHFGLGLVRGAGAAGRKARSRRCRGRPRVNRLAQEGFSIALTGDIPPGPARKCGVGIVLISSRSGRPIVPFAVATSAIAR
jgi:3-deoxy-D-manno-octulosonic-acid transferase